MVALNINSSHFTRLYQTAREALIAELRIELEALKQKTQNAEALNEQRKAAEAKCEDLQQRLTTAEAAMVSH